MQKKKNQWQQSESKQVVDLYSTSCWSSAPGGAFQWGGMEGLGQSQHRLRTEIICLSKKKHLNTLHILYMCEVYSINKMKSEVNYCFSFPDSSLPYHEPRLAQTFNYIINYYRSKWSAHSLLHIFTTFPSAPIKVTTRRHNKVSSLNQVHHLSLYSIPFFTEALKHNTTLKHNRLHIVCGGQ